MGEEQAVRLGRRRVQGGHHRKHQAHQLAHDRVQASRRAVTHVTAMVMGQQQSLQVRQSQPASQPPAGPVRQEQVSYGGDRLGDQWLQ